MTGRLTIIFVVVAILSAVFSLSARADLFTVSGVDVDVQAESASAARDQALSQGRVQAFQRLLHRLTRREDHLLLPFLGSAEVEPLILSLQVGNEKTAPDRYIATLSFQFAAQPVRDLLTANAITFTEARALPALVVPVLTENGIPAIWSDPNLWLDAWAAIDGRERHVPAILPFGDIEDVVLLTPEQAVLGDSVALMALAGRYNAETAIIVEALPERDPTTDYLRVTVNVTSFGADTYPAFSLAFEGPVSGEPLRFLEQVADQVLSEVEEGWKLATIESFSQEFQLTALVPFTGMQDWLDISSRLSDVDLVRDQRLSALTVRDAVVDITHVGEIELFSRSLARVGLQIAQQPDGFWVLSRLEGRQ